MKTIQKEKIFTAQSYGNLKDYLINNELYIDSELILNTQLMHAICKSLPKKCSIIVTDYTRRPNMEYYENEIVQLNRSIDIIQSLGHRIYFSSNVYNYLNETGFSIDTIHTVTELNNANAQLSMWEKQILNAHCENELLSPFEKYLLAYRLINNYTNKFSHSTKEQSKSYALASTPNNKWVVGANCANILHELCSRIGIRCVKSKVYVEDASDFITGHDLCVVKIIDEKYGINGTYYADPITDYCNILEAENGNIIFCLMNLVFAYENYNAYFETHYYGGKIKFGENSGAEFDYLQGHTDKILTPPRDIIEHNKQQIISNTSFEKAMIKTLLRDGFNYPITLKYRNDIEMKKLSSILTKELISLFDFLSNEAKPMQEYFDKINEIKDYYKINSQQFYEILAANTDQQSAQDLYNAFEKLKKEYLILNIENSKIPNRSQTTKALYTALLSTGMDDFEAIPLTEKLIFASFGYDKEK